jgi:RHS repeat-associated protein
MRILAGMYADAETGLYYWGARYYDPKTRGAIGSDSIETD